VGGGRKHYEGKTGVGVEVELEMRVGDAPGLVFIGDAKNIT
jgi:hypothetical protein